MSRLLCNVTKHGQLRLKYMKVCIVFNLGKGGYLVSCTTMHSTENVSPAFNPTPLYQRELIDIHIFGDRGKVS